MNPDAPTTNTLHALADQWRACGVSSGDTVLLHSDIVRTLMAYRRRGHALRPEDILESFLIALGDAGTLLLPLFNFDFAKGVPFDMRNTPSHMGVLTETARHRTDVVRTGNPFYSFAVLGKRARDFSHVINESGYGRDSPFGMLRDLDGKIAALDLTDQRCMTFYHHVEEMEQVPYRYFKTFRGTYVDATGQASQREFRLYVRNLEHGVVTDLDGMERLLWEKGLYRGERPGVGPGLRTIPAQRMFNATSDVIRSGQAEHMLYRIEKKAPTVS